MTLVLALALSVSSVALAFASALSVASIALAFALALSVSSIALALASARNLNQNRNLKLVYNHSQIYTPPSVVEQVEQVVVEHVEVADVELLL